jgi:3-oxoacyl-[acyl-carrier protein] reductase
MDLGLKGRTALVTGSSSGIGRATAEILGREGVNVAVTYLTNRSGAECVATRIHESGGDAHVVSFDLAAIESIRAAIETVLTRWGRIDILVNNAVAWGLRAPSQAPPFERLPPAEWREGLRTNIEGTYATIQAVLPSMRQAKWGRIVNVSSLAAEDGLSGAGWYSAAKASLHGLTRTLAREVGGDGILANVVMPGLTLSERVSKYVPAAARQRTVAATPIGRLLEPADIASVVVFLCSAANTAITGQVVRASGGN